MELRFSTTHHTRTVIVSTVKISTGNIFVFSVYKYYYLGSKLITVHQYQVQSLPPRIGKDLTNITVFTSQVT